MSSLLDRLAQASTICLSLSAVCYCCLTLSCFAIVIFLGTRSPVAGPTTSLLQVGDILSNSSALIKANYSVSSATFFLVPEGTVYVTTTEPPTITDHLSPKHLSISSIRYDLNYLGLMTPIYLLPGSILHYNVSIISNERLDSSYSACIYLFTSLTQFQNFLSFLENGNSSKISYCFTSPVTPRQPTLASHSFDIVETSKYYVGVELVNGANVIMMANVSVVRVYYDTRGLSPRCSMAQFCYISTCDELLCSHSSSSATYILVQAPADSSIQYEMTTAALFGANYVYFFLALSLGNFSSCCCFICCCWCCIALRSLSIHDSSEGRNYSRLRNYDD